MSPRHSRRGAVDRRRYRRVTGFAFRVLLHALLFDLVLNRPLLRRLRPPALDRWRRIARRYRELATELGGVLIKLGQFLSTRVDVIPLEVTRELAALQDEVPPVAFDAVRERIERDLGAPVAERFASVETSVSGSASLAQVHRARTLDGDRVVVKVLRPGIERLVETDLAAFSTAVRWLRFSRRLRRRADVRWIEREFRTVTSRELDLETEGRSAERFAHDFAAEPRVRVPAVRWDLSAAGTLLPEADVDRLVEAHREVLDRFWGVRLADLRDAALEEGSELVLEYRDLLLDAPIQLQADMIFALRAVGLLAGLCTHLDPAFDPWRETVPYARRFASEERAGLLEGLGDLAQSMLRLPAQLDRLLERAERGALGVRATPSPETRRAHARLEVRIERLTWAVLAAALAVAAAILRAADPADPAMPWLAAGAAASFAIALLRRPRGGRPE